MKRIKISKIVFVVILTLTLVFIPVVKEKLIFSDSGFDTSYSSGGSSWSSSSSGSSHSSSRSSSSDSSHEMTEEESRITTAFLFVIFFGVWGLILFTIYSAFKAEKSTFTTPKNVEEKREKAFALIRQYIPDFDEGVFIDKCYRIYLDVQDAWMNFNLESVKNVITNELYAQYESQLSTLEVKGEQNIMKDFDLNYGKVIDAQVVNNEMNITTEFVIDFYDYIIEKETGKVLRGSSNSKVVMTYEMNFRMSLNDIKKITKCPNCGAEVDIVTSGKCSFCHTKLVNDNNAEWVLTQKRAIAQDRL